MPLHNAKKLLKEAETRKLTPKERRHCIAYLLGSSPNVRTVELAELFKVTERMIRRDREIIREEFAKEIRGIDPALILSDLAMELEAQLRNIDESMKKAQKGSKVYLSHCIAKVKLRGEVIERLSNVGFLPKELGNITVEKFEYKTVQGKQGELNCRRVDEFDYLMEPGAVNALPAGEPEPEQESEVQDAEFNDVPESEPDSQPVDGENSED